MGLYSEADAATWAASSVPELNGSGLLVKNEKTDQPLGEGGDAGYSSNGSVKSALGDVLDHTVILYDVPLWREDDEVQAIVKQLDGDVSVDSMTRVSWTPGDMGLTAWRLNGGGVLGLVGTVLRDQDTETCMYLIGNRQYNAERSRQKEAAGESGAWE